MPRVLRIINRFNLGGPTYNASYLTRYMAPEFETYLVGGKKDDSEENSEFIVRSLGIEPVTIPEMRRTLNPYKDYVALRKLRKIIADFRPDIVHTHASKAGALGRRAAWEMKVPVVVHTFHGHVFDSYFSGFKSEVYQTIERNLARKSTKIIALSEIQKADLVDRFRICEEAKVEIIPLGFDLDRFQENISEKRAEFRQKYQISGHEIAIGIVGRVVPIKNHSLFLKAIAWIKSRSQVPVRAFVVGDGEDKDKMMEFCGSLGLDCCDALKELKPATVTFTSWIKDVDYVNAGMDIIALTSLNEGTPVSLIEAQASGKPIVTTNVGSIENIVMPGVTAFLSKIGDPVDFYEKLLVLVENEEIRKRLSANGWRYVKEKFHYSRLVDDMKNLYYKLLREKNINF